jgi:hypothetical protein
MPSFSNVLVYLEGGGMNYRGLCARVWCVYMHVYGWDYSIFLSSSRKFNQDL